MSFFKKLGIFFALSLTCTALQASHSHSECSCSASKVDWNKLLQGNENFVNNSEYARERARLARGQNPHYAIVCCSDSRVPPEIIFEQGLGDLFVAREAGNTVDTITVDSLEFAVATWDVTTVIVLGHTKCGAVEGALARLRQNNGKISKIVGDHFNAVLIPIQKAILKYDVDIWADNAVELSTQANIAYGARQLVKRSTFINQALKDGKIILVGAEYGMKSGRVQNLFTYECKGIKYSCAWKLGKK